MFGRLARRLFAVAFVIVVPAVASAELRILGNPKDYRTVLAPEALSPSRCEAVAGRIWVKHAYGVHCIAYYISSNGNPAKPPVIFFDGDVTPAMFRDQKKIDDYLAGVRQAFDVMSRRATVTMIYVARPGLFGSSGNHGFRRSREEAHALNRAIDLIKTRHGFKEVVLAGQSGGAWAVASLLTLGRNDVPCAVAASGGFDLVDDVIRTARKRGRDIPKAALEDIDFGPFYDVMQFTAKIPKAPTRRLFVIGDVNDQRTPFAQQRRFADKLRAGGHRVALIEGHAKDAEHHGLGVVAAQAAAACAQGRPDSDIERLVAAP